MVDLKSRLARTRFFRRATTSSLPTVSPPTTPSPGQPPYTQEISSATAVNKDSASQRQQQERKQPNANIVERKTGKADNDRPASPTHVDPRRSESFNSGDPHTLQSSIVTLPSPSETIPKAPEVIVEAPTPDQAPQSDKKDTRGIEPPTHIEQQAQPPSTSKPTSNQTNVDIPPLRKQSLVDSSNAHIIQALLRADSLGENKAERQRESLGAPTKLHPSMLHRKVWVKRAGASATLVQVREDDLVDDMRDAILRKYGNSLGRSFDAPDVTLRITARIEQGHKHSERVLGPEEQICQALDQVYPGGQTVEEALIIDVPQRRTPRPSPRAVHQHMHAYIDETARPLETGADYFPPMPAVAGSPAISHHSSHTNVEHARSMSVLNTGQVPPLPLPSPGGSRRPHHNRTNRPTYIRQHTSSPTSITAPPNALKGARPRLDSSSSDHRHMIVATGTAPLPTPPLQTHDGSIIAPTSGLVNSTNADAPRVSSPRPVKREKRNKKPPTEAPPILTSLGLDISVPPISILIVEDNHINLKLLEQFVRRLKVRWATAVNGREAVNKWRDGGFHLVLMDIQLPIMSGLEATKEIRRLERVNGIGVFSGSNASSEAPKWIPPEQEEDAAPAEGDKLDVERLFKSPVIIVALTASNLQSDRHEALAAGCNDFLTKPVNFVWFERKVKEWGCMQALIDFDGWRKWKDFASTAVAKPVNGTKDKKPLKEPVNSKKPAALKQALPVDDSADNSTPEAGSSSS